MTRKMEAAIACLLSEATHEQAAARAGIGIATLQRWLLLPEFQAAYRQARAAVLERVVTRLLAVSGKAVERLAANLDGPGNVSNRAAVAILQQAVKGAETLDIADELTWLRAAVLELQRGKLLPSPAGATAGRNGAGVDAGTR